MRIGYARTSTVEQVAGLEAQERDVRDAGCEKTFVEQVSSVAQRRPQLDAAMEFAREGDVFVVTRLDRAARSVRDLLEIEERLSTKGVSLQITSMALDTGTPQGRLMFQIFGAVAEFERGVMLVRQREGIAKAKSEGRYKGRKPIPKEKAEGVLRLDAERVKKTEIASRLKISRASVHRIILANKKAA